MPRTRARLPIDDDRVGAFAIAGHLPATPEPVDESNAAQVAAMIYTSGTTGNPKGVMLTHRNVLFIAVVSGAARALSADDLVYAVLPLSHVFGLASTCLGTINAGGALRLVNRFDPAHLAEALARRRHRVPGRAGDVRAPSRAPRPPRRSARRAAPALHVRRRRAARSRLEAAHRGALRAHAQQRLRPHRGVADGRPDPHRRPARRRLRSVRRCPGSRSASSIRMGATCRKAKSARLGSAGRTS